MEFGESRDFYMENKTMEKRINHQNRQRFVHAAKLFAIYYVIELVLLLILRFCFRGANLRDILSYCVVSAILLLGGMMIRELWHKRVPSDLMLLGFAAYSFYFFGERIMSEVYVAIGTLPYWMNVAAIWAFLLIVYGFSVSVRIPVGVVGAFYILLSVINAVLKQFRGRGIDAIDFYSVKAAMKVAGRFRYQVSAGMVIGLLCIAGMFWVLFFYVKGQKSFSEWKRESPAGSMKNKAARALIFAAGVGVFVFILGTDVLEKRGYTPAYSSERNGVLFNILFQLKYLSLDVPDDYDERVVYEAAERYVSGEPGDLSGYPNIIVIMNEALSDLSVYGEFETNLPVLPYLDSADQNMKKGYAYSSVYAGNTAVSEYEFLTGDSNALFQTMPYATMIKSGTQPQTLVSALNELGYTTIAMHSYYNSAYRRTTVYDVLGFDRIFFMEDMEELEYLREFATDASQYRTIYKMFEQKEDSERLFVFNVTMQNHMDYDYENAEFAEPIVLTEYPGQYKQVEQYLSCIHESDRAFRELTDYFAVVSEPTVILMFGDHQPKLEEEFYNRIAGTSDSYVEENGIQYLVPHVMWANYELEESFCGLTSLNYLQANLMDAAGLPLTGYQQYLLKLQQQYPVISSHYVITAGGSVRFTQDCIGDLSEYRSVMYNHMSNISHNPPGFFHYR